MKNENEKPYKASEEPWEILTIPAGDYEIKFQGEDPANYEGECDDVVIATKGGFTIAKVYNPDAQFVQHGELPIAKLLCAAPEMLETLELALDRLADSKYKDKFCFIRARLERAINKAKGGE